MAGGWLKIHRKIADWEWYQDANVFRVFFHCLMRANFEDTVWRGQEIKRGQFVTSLDTLVLETGLTKSQVRTSLDKLKKSGEIASLSQARSRVITVVKYDQHQADDRLIAPKSQRNRTRDSSEIATVKNLRNKELNNSSTAGPEILCDGVNVDQHNFHKKPMTYDWEPCNDFETRAKMMAVDLHQLDQTDFEASKAEFRQYWKDSGKNETQSAWTTKFIKNLIRVIERKQAEIQKRSSDTSTRDITIEQQVNDRSWAL